MTEVISIIAIIVTVLNLIALFVCISKVKKYQRMYESSLAKFNNTANVKDKFVDLFARLDDVEQKCKDTENVIKEYEEVLGTAIKKIGLVKYDAYDEMR